MPGIDTYTKLMLHMDGISTPTVITDSATSAPDCPHTVTATNAVLTSTLPKFGDACCVFDGNGDYLSIPNSTDFYMANDEFTIDFWIKLNALPGLNDAAVICSQFESTNDYVRVMLFNDAGVTKWYIDAVLSTDLKMRVGRLPAAALSTSTWYHIAIVGSGTGIVIYQDGVVCAVSGTDTFQYWPAFSNDFEIGRQNNVAGYYYLNGWIDEFRVSHDIQRWTSAFTPPTAPYDTDEAPAGVSLGMTIPQLISALREILCDERWPYKWQDSAFVRYLNEAEEQACRRAYLIRDAITASYCGFSVSVSVQSYLLHSRVLYINRVVTTSNTIPLTQMTRDTMDKLELGWISTTGTPQLFFHEANHELIMYPIPQSIAMASLIVTRLPLNSFSNGPTETPELLPQYHNDLLLWALAKAYEKRLSKPKLGSRIIKNTNDTQNIPLSADYERRFEARFGALLPANFERLRRTLDKKRLRQMIRKGEGIIVPKGVNA